MYALISVTDMALFRSDIINKELVEKVLRKNEVSEFFHSLKMSISQTTSSNLREQIGLQLVH